MLSLAKVTVKQDEVIEQLTLLNVTKYLLTEAVKKGHAARANTTENDPPGAAGTMAFFAIVRALRESLIPIGWKKKTISNLSLTCNPATSIAIVVSSGDKNVGIESQYSVAPKTKNPKGKKTEDYILGNLDLIETFVEKTNKAHEFQTWVMLYFYDHLNSQIRLELSLPIDMDSYGHVNSWRQRIILPPVLLDNLLPESPNLNNLPDIVIPIERRRK